LFAGVSRLDGGDEWDTVLSMEGETKEELLEVGSVIL
jgi:hypothetical protein